MAAGAMTAAQLGSFFVRNYYHTVRTRPDLVHLFYKNTSSMVRIDGDTIVTADTMQEINIVMMSLNFVSVETRIVKSLRSLGGGITILVSGSVGMRNHNGRRKFAQNFFLAPQDRGYFVLSDIFFLLEEESVPPLGDPCVLDLSNYPPETIASDSGLEDEATDYVQPLELGEDLGSDHGFDEQQSVVCESPAVHEDEDPGTVGKKQSDEARERVPQKMTYASILVFGRDQPEASTSRHQVVNQRAPLASTRHPVVQQLQGEASYVAETNRAVDGNSGEDDDSKLKSVFVGNLPSTVTIARLELEFKQFGTVKPDSIFIKRKPNAAVTYAFVHFETMDAVHAAIQRSAIHLDGKRVCIKKRRANATGASQRGRSGRGSDG